MIFPIDGSSFPKVIDEQNTRCIPKYGGLLMFASLVTLDSFNLLLSTQLTANLTPEWRGRFVSSIVTYLCKNSFLLHWKSCKQHWIINVLLFLINCEQTWHPLSTHLSHLQMFMQNGEYTAFWYLQLLCYLMQLQFTISQNKFVEFLVFSGTTAKFGWPERSASFMPVRPCLK